jgi:hypothetical protein
MPPGSRCSSMATVGSAVRVSRAVDELGMSSAAAGIPSATFTSNGRRQQNKNLRVGQDGGVEVPTARTKPPRGGIVSASVKRSRFPPLGRSRPCGVWELGATKRTRRFENGETMDSDTGNEVGKKQARAAISTDATLGERVYGLKWESRSCRSVELSPTLSITAAN